MGAARMVVLAIIINLRVPEGGHPVWLVARLQASIILTSLQGADHEHPLFPSRKT